MRFRRRRYGQNNSISLRKIKGIMIFIGGCLAIAFVLSICSLIVSFLMSNVWIIVSALVIASAAILIYLAIRSMDRCCNEFASEHSVAIKRLEEINRRYTFKYVLSNNMVNSYDNVSIYSEISPWDYLVYQLVKDKESVLKAIACAEENARMFAEYQAEVNEITAFGMFDSQFPKILYRNICKKEKKIFSESTSTPCTQYTIRVSLCLTNINGRYQTKKEDLFGAHEIKNAISGIENQRDGYYFDRQIWNSICRVERGKVTNRIRFAVYQRDGNRCRRCGSTYNLEIDHIFPISKGGKSTFDNLQTLCHTCNVRKSNAVEKCSDRGNGPIPRCPLCGALLTVKIGKHGKFYGCFNYPECRYTTKYN